MIWSWNGNRGVFVWFSLRATAFIYLKRTICAFRMTWFEKRMTFSMSCNIARGSKSHWLLITLRPGELCFLRLSPCLKAAGKICGVIRKRIYGQHVINHGLWELQRALCWARLILSIYRYEWTLFVAGMHNMICEIAWWLFKCLTFLNQHENSLRTTTHANQTLALAQTGTAKTSKLI